MKKEQIKGEIERLSFTEIDYDLDGLIRLAECEEAALIFTFEDEEEQKFYMNRHECLELHMPIEQKIRAIHRYLEVDEAHGLFISFAVRYEGKLRVLSEKREKAKELDLGELELGNHMIYGVLIRYQEGQYLFDEVVYFDGENKSHSWAEPILDAGELTPLLKSMIIDFAD